MCAFLSEVKLLILFLLISFFGGLASAESLVHDEAVFRWQSVAGAESYVIEIARDPEFSKPVEAREVHNPQYTWKDFVPGVYFWRVAARTKKRRGLFGDAALADLTTIESARQSLIQMTVVMSGPVPEISKPAT